MASEVEEEGEEEAMNCIGGKKEERAGVGEGEEAKTRVQIWGISYFSRSLTGSLELTCMTQDIDMSDAISAGGHRREVQLVHKTSLLPLAPLATI